MSYSVEQIVRDFHRETQEYDVCVIGGGMAGLIAAVASARRGAKTVLIHDRPVLGGNASSEIRMWICGAHGRNMKETGILEEIQLDNCYRNPQLIYPIWDSVLFEKAFFTPNLTTHLNTTCLDGEVDDHKRILSIKAWNLTSQTCLTIHARQFIDCSGDSILAPLTGARVRIGREAASEFHEDIEPSRADNRTMGNTLLLQLRRTDQPQPYIPPRWAYRFENESDLPHRLGDGMGGNFWWLELGGLQDTIRDAPDIQFELMRVAYGVWDYLKHRSPKRGKLENWVLEFAGSLPGKRENRRYVGHHILTQNDIRDGGQFDDIVAYGGWSMDDHHPAGLLYPGAPTIFHPAPSPYGIPYRSLCSADVPNMLMAGRNISASHAALSSTRVMATTSLLGQAVGTAAAMCIERDCDPVELHPSRIAELQQRLMDDDCFLPGLRRSIDPLTHAAQAKGPGDVPKLFDGHDRPIGENDHLWQAEIGTSIIFDWPQTVHIKALRILLDSNLNHEKRMPHRYPASNRMEQPPETLLRDIRIETQLADGSWQRVSCVQDNHHRLVRHPLDLQTRGLRITPESTWGANHARIFSIDVCEHQAVSQSQPPLGMTWSQRRAQVPPQDLAPPVSGLETETRTTGSA